MVAVKESIILCGSRNQKYTDSKTLISFNLKGARCHVAYPCTPNNLIDVMRVGVEVEKQRKNRIEKKYKKSKSVNSKYLRKK